MRFWVFWTAVGVQSGWRDVSVDLQIFLCLLFFGVQVFFKIVDTLVWDDLRRSKTQFLSVSHQAQPRDVLGLPQT